LLYYKDCLISFPNLGEICIFIFISWFFVDYSTIAQ
jgi:hypothetical protein